MTDLAAQAAPLWNLVARAFGVKPAERSSGVCATSEAKVGRELAKLPAGWHAVPIGDRSSDIDHVVIGPRGVFTLTTKHHPDATVCVYEQGLWIDGLSTVYLHNSRCQAKRAAQVLATACGVPVGVHAAIVFVDPAKLTPKGTPADVHITTLRTLRTFLMQQPRRLTSSQVDHISTVARNIVTWQPA